MYRLTLILIALALPIVGMAQTNCIDDPGAEFVFNDTIHNFNYCSPTSLSTELTACYLEQIKVTFSGVENPDMLVIDIRRPGANYPMRFASSGLLSSENYDGFLSQDSCPSSQIIPWDNSTLGGGFFILNVSGWSGYNLTGIWDVGLSFIGSSFTPNEISLDFVGSCLSCSGCMDYTACNYDPSATSDDGSCDFISCYQLGCTDPSACNYDSAADTNDGSCEFTSCVGCTDSTACNYDSTATIAFEGSCIYLVTGYNCDGSCIVDSDGDGICNLFEILGCTDVLSENYNPLATDDDGSCVIFISGCTYSAACNYNEMATSDDGSCDFDSCYTVIEGCTYPNACNYSASAIEDDGTCFYPDVVGVCGGNCTSDADNDGICDDIDDCVGIVDVCGVCNGQGLCGGGIPIWLEISNPFLEMSYVQNAAPFFSMYNGWFDADFVKIGICNPQVNLAQGQGQGQASSSAFTISINFEDSPEFVVTVEAPLFQQVLTLQLPSGPNAPTASQIVSIRLQDDTGNTLDNLYQDGTPWPNVTLNGINHAPGQHRIVRQPGVLQGNTEVNESEWLVADENQDVPYFSSWNLGSTIMVPMVEDDQGENDQGCQGDEDGDGICDELEIPMFCDNVNTTNYSPLHNTLICEEAEVMEYWISSFNLAEIAQQGGLLPPMDLGQEPVASEMVASSICSTGASQLAFCNYGQRAFVVNENMRSVDIINYGDLGNPVPISDGIGGFRSISANDIASELVLRGLTSVLRAGLVPSDVDIYNME
ncbi:MAG: hypothetical protein O2852_05865, partial [Bacteroidetes bacterium]|nr:hypothetical protein [Bacteroidota bacterium]